MTYSVFVQSTEKQGYNAIVLGFPFLRAEGATKKEAIDKVRAMLANFMASGDIVHVEVFGSLTDAKGFRFASLTDDFVLRDESLIAGPDEPVPEADSPQPWQELESLSAILRAEALSDGQTVADVLNKLPEIRREVFEELYGKEQVEAWEKEWKDEGSYAST